MGVLKVPVYPMSAVRRDLLGFSFRKKQQNEEHLRRGIRDASIDLLPNRDVIKTLSWTSILKQLYSDIAATHYFGISCIHFKAYKES